jgi:hypothetical protein
MSGNGYGGPRDGAGSKKTDHAKGKITTFLRKKVPTEPEPALVPTTTHAEVAATRKAARDEEMERKEREKREKREEGLKNQEEGLELLAEAAATENNSGITGLNIVDEEESDHESDDESWDSDDEGEDDEETTHNEPRANIKRRNRQAYKPPHGSDFRLYLNKIKDKILQGEDMEFKRGKREYPPMKDPLVKPHNANATDFYESQYHVYVWYPFIQYKATCQLSSFHCIHCKQKTLQSKEYDVRPMFSFDKVYYCNHRRLRCRDCCKTFAEIDPRFLPQFPTDIVSRFKFMTTIEGCGVDTMMLYHFANLHCTGTSPGRYVKSLNELLSLKYHMEWANYMEGLVGFRQYEETWGCEAKILQPFKPFQSPGFYNGILLPRSLWRKCWLEFMQSKEPRLQASFQLRYSDGVSADHAEKFPQRIHISGREGKPFQTSYSGMETQGNVSISRINSGKSNDELKATVTGYRCGRDVGGAKELKAFCGDGGPDRQVWKDEFPDLQSGIKPCTPTHLGGYPVILENVEDLLVLVSKAEVEEWALAIAQLIRARTIPLQEEKIHVSIASQWNLGDTKESTRAFQMKWPDWIESRSVLIHLHAMDMLKGDIFVPELRDLLQFPNIVAVGVMVMFNVNRLKCLGVDIKSRICLTALGKIIDPEIGKYDMKSLCRRYLDCTVDKISAESDWKEHPLPHKLLQYAATDVKVGMRLLDIMKPLGEEISAESAVLSPYGSTQLNPGDSVVYCINGDDCARGTIVHVGDRSKRRPYGTLQNIAPGKVIVKLTSVIRWNTRPIESFIPSEEQKSCGGLSAWKASKTSLQKIWSLWKEKKQEPLLVLPLACIKIHVRRAEDITPMALSEDNAAGSLRDDGENNQADGDPSLDDNLDDDVRPASKDKDQADADDTSPDDHLDDDVLPASKDKRDLFHKFQSFPMQQCDPNYTLITRLLIHTTFDMDQTDYLGVAAHLARTEDIHSEDELLDHFYYNREWWRKRVKMTIPDRDTHAQAVRNLHGFVKKYISPNDARMADYFDSFEREIQEGLFDEINDLQMYDEDGQDSHGLNLYFSRRGSNRVELYHRFLMLAIGPTTYGPEVAHYLMVLVTARFNVNTGVARLNDYDFGHPWHEFIDRIQIRHMQVYGCNIFPKYKNLSLTETVPDFVAVGFGPVSFDTDSVEPSDEPHPNLTGNLRWLAARMKVKLPPLNVSGKREKQFCNNYFRDNPKPTTTKLKELSRMFKAEADGIDMFPKLVSQLKTYYGQWKKNNAIRLVGAKIREPYRVFLRGLANFPKVSLTEDLHDCADSTFEAGAEDITREAAGLLQHDNSPHVGVTSGMNPHPVAPAAAVGQTNFVPAVPILQHNRIRGTNKNWDSCFYYPRCESLECGGQKEGSRMCKFVVSGQIPIEDLEKFFKEKEESKKRQRAARCKEARGTKRRQNEGNMP